MKKLHKDRLLKLAAFLRTVPIKQFDMGWWVEADKKGHNHEHASLKCGTTACALGWATAVFPQLYYDVETSSILIKNHEYDNYELNEETAKVFFGLTEDGFEDLFMGSAKTGKEEAAIIEKFVRTGVVV